MSILSMTIRSLQTVAAFALLACPVFLAAQEISASEEERLENLARANAEVYVPKTSVNLGFRMLSSGAAVHFGRLGNVPVNTTIAPASEGAVRRLYNNGTVSVDAIRDEETASTTTTLPGGRYQTSTNVTDMGPDGVLGTADDVTTNVITGNRLSYQAGVTRNWSDNSATQLTTKPGYVAMSSYSATSDGGFRDSKQGATAGMELQYTRAFGRLSRRTEWSVITGISLNSINGKTSGSVVSTLHTSTDFYSFNGLAAPGAPYVAPSTGDLNDANGNLILTGGLETTTPISSVPDATLSTTTAATGGTTVNGNWQVKGGYFMVKLGPSLHTQFTERFGVSASLGMAGAYAGTHYTAVESFVTPDNNGVIVSTEEVSDANKFLAGFYADLNFEWAANERTGLFAGLSAQKFDGYDQSVGGRTARIDLGSTVGLRGGISIRY
ncbi:MAG: hypothetical protein WCR49_11935 [Opitutae bacterium]